MLALWTWTIWKGWRIRDSLLGTNMKCDPAKSAELIEQYAGIYFGPHSDKKYWISVRPGATPPTPLFANSSSIRSAKSFANS